MPLLASVKPLPSALMCIYTVPVSRSAVVNINCCNTSSAFSAVSIAVSTTPEPAEAGWIEWNVNLSEGGVLERTGIALKAGQCLFVRAESGGVAVNVWGIEELA